MLIQIDTNKAIKESVAGTITLLKKMSTQGLDPVNDLEFLIELSINNIVNSATTAVVPSTIIDDFYQKEK